MILVSAMTDTKTLPHGIYVPIVTFFSDDPVVGIDAETTTTHVLRLAKAGVTGIVTCGTYGEGVLTTAAERISLISTIRKAFDDNGFDQLRIIAGVSDNSVRGAISNSVDAANAGADAVICVPPSYYKPLVNDEYLIQFFTQLADSSPVPVFLYNYPAVTAGIDISSEVMIILGQHPNILGAKFTCGNLGKLTRVVAAAKAANKPFLAFAGFVDFLIPSLAAGGAGAIAGPANIAPHAVMQAYNQFANGGSKGKEAAYGSQYDLAVLDNDLMKLGLEGTKLYLQRLYKAGDHAARVRCPSTVLNQNQVDEIMAIGEKYVD